MKTTNAKARAFQTPGGLDTEHKPLQQPTSTRPLRQKIKPTEGVKLEIHADSPLRYEDREPEYCPPRWIEPPYVNDDIDVESLDYSIVHKAAQSEAFYMRYGGASARRREREAEEAAKKRMDREDEEFLRRMEDEDILIEDVPETHSKKVAKEPVTGTRVPPHQRSASAIVRKPTTASRTTIPAQAPSTVVSRRAASVLGGVNSIEPRTASSRPPSTSTTSSHNRSASSGAPLAKKPLPFGLGARKSAVRTNVPASAVPSTMRATSALANSRSTIGYNKGRTASSALNSAFEPTSTSNSVSAARPSSRGGMSSGGGAVRPRIGLQRSSTTIFTNIGESTITPVKWASRHMDAEDRGTSNSLLEAFEGEEDKDDLGVAHLRLGGEVELPECLRLKEGEEEEEFVMTLHF